MSLTVSIGQRGEVSQLLPVVTCVWEILLLSPVWQRQVDRSSLSMTRSIEEKLAK